MKKNAYVIDFTAQTLTLTAAFVDAANNPGSKEYRLLRQFQRDFPNLRIVRKTHNTPTRYHNSDGTTTARNKRDGLTYERMERFMNALPNGADYIAAYTELRAKANAMCASPYAAVSDWFMEQFPDYRKSPLTYLKNQPKVIDFSAVLEKAQAKPPVEGDQSEDSEEKIS